MTRIVGIIFLLIIGGGALFAQKTDRKLQASVETLVNGFGGQVGVFIQHLPSGKTVEYQADTLFPTASMVKIPILAGIMDKISKKELHYHQQLLYRDSLLYPGEDILGSFRDSSGIQLAKIMLLMMTTSDNTASLWLQLLAGTGTPINQLMDSLGFVHTRVNSRTEGRQENWRVFGWGQTTPREMARIMERLYHRQLLGKESDEQMLRLMGRNYWNEEALSQIPPEIFVASKNGAVNASRSETLLVMAPSGPYIFSIITKNQTDTSWNSNNEGWVLSRKLSRLLWNYFEPKYPWKPLIDLNGNTEENRQD